MQNKAADLRRTVHLGLWVSQGAFVELSQGSCSSSLMRLPLTQWRTWRTHGIGLGLGGGSIGPVEICVYAVFRARVRGREFFVLLNECLMFVCANRILPKSGTDAPSTIHARMIITPMFPVQTIACLLDCVKSKNGTLCVLVGQVVKSMFHV